MDNPKVSSKGGRNAGANGFKPSDPRQGKQPAKIEQRDLPSGIHSRDVHKPGKLVHETVGHLPGGGWANPTHPNASQGKLDPSHIHRPGTESKPSGRTITK
jgi:hypothetical protein